MATATHSTENERVLSDELGSMLRQSELFQKLGVVGLVNFRLSPEYEAVRREIRARRY